MLRNSWLHRLLSTCVFAMLLCIMPPTTLIILASPQFEMSPLNCIEPNLMCGGPYSCNENQYAIRKSPAAECVTARRQITHIIINLHCRTGYIHRPGYAHGKSPLMRQNETFIRGCSELTVTWRIQVFPRWMFATILYIAFWWSPARQYQSWNRVLRFRLCLLTPVSWEWHCINIRLQICIFATAIYQTPPIAAKLLFSDYSCKGTSVGKKAWWLIFSLLLPLPVLTVRVGYRMRVKRRSWPTFDVWLFSGVQHGTYEIGLSTIASAFSR